MKLEQTENIKVVVDTVRSKEERRNSLKDIRVKYNRLQMPTMARGDSPTSLKAKKALLLELLRSNALEDPK